MDLRVKLAQQETITDANGCQFITSIFVDGSGSDPCSNSTLDLSFDYDQSIAILTANPIGGVPPYATRWDTGEALHSNTCRTYPKSYLRI